MSGSGGRSRRDAAPPARQAPHASAGRGTGSGDDDAALSYDRLYSLSEIDDVVLGQIGRIRFTLADVVLLLLYADPHPIQGKIRQMKQVFLALREVLPEADVEPVKFEPKQFGPYSEDVEDTIEQLAFANYVAITGKSRRDYKLSITPKGRAYIASRFDALPVAIREKFAQKRREWNTLTPAGMMHYVYVHNPKFLEKSILKNRYKGMDWSDDDLEAKK